MVGRLSLGGVGIGVRTCTHAHAHTHDSVCRLGQAWTEVVQSSAARLLVIEGLRGNASYLVEVAAWTVIGRGEAVLLSPSAVGSDLPAPPDVVTTEALSATELQVRVPHRRRGHVTLSMALCFCPISARRVNVDLAAAITAEL